MTEYYDDELDKRRCGNCKRLYYLTKAASSGFITAGKADVLCRECREISQRAKDGYSNRFGTVPFVEAE